MIQLQLGIISITFHLYGLIIGIAACFVYWYVAKNGLNFNISKKLQNLVFVVCLPMALIFARLYHVLDNLVFYRQNISNVLFVWDGGLGIIGGLIGILAGLLIISKITNVKLLSFLNLFFPPLLLAQAIGRLGNIINREPFWPEAIPLTILFIGYIFLKRKYRNFKDYGFSYYLIGYGIVRFIEEFFRSDTWRIGNIPVASFFSLFMMLLGILLIYVQFRRFKR